MAKPTTSLTVPSEALLEKMKADGRNISGLSNDANDLQMPRLAIAQTGSPQCNKHEANYIADCEPGDLFINSTGMRFAGETGVPAIYCAQVHCVIQWAAGRNGFIARHATMPGDARQEHVEGKKRPVLVNADGDVYEPQREIFLSINTGSGWLPCVFSAKSTMHTVARKWQTDLHMKCRYNGANLPTYAHVYHLTTVPMRNALGSWFILKPDHIGLITEDAVYEAAKQFAEFAATGRAFVDHSDHIADPAD
jgi:hypothetical protein